MIYALIAIVGFLIASYTDLKTREVPEWLSTGLIVIGISAHAIDSMFSQNLSPILSASYMAVLAFAFSYSLYKIGAWAGGDVKLFTALGAVLPAYGTLDYVPFLVFIASFLTALPFALLYICSFFIRVKRLRKLIAPVLSRDLKRAVLSSSYLVASYFIILVSGVHWVFLLPLTYILHKLSVPGIAITVILMTFYFLSDYRAFLSYFAYATAVLFLVLFGIHLFGLARKNVLRMKIAANALKEGMIPAEDVYIGNKKIADSMNADGLSAKGVAALKKAKRGISVRLSIPFVPVLALGLIVLLVLEKVIK